MQFTIVWSNKCNLTCDYCCVYDSLNKGSSLSIEDAVKFFEWQLPLYSKEEEHVVEFFGGEPTLHMDEIRALMNHLELYFSDYNLRYRIYTNCIFNKTIRSYDDVWSKFDDIICSIDGMYEDNLLRTTSRKAYDISIENFNYLKDTYKVAGIAFVLHPESDLRKTFNYFKDMGCRYFHFEIASLWNDDKDNGITVEYLIKTFRTIHELTLEFNSKHLNKEEFIVFSVPREFLSSDKFFTGPEKHSCLDVMRSLSPTGNVYFCRDLAVSEFHLGPKSTDSTVFFKTSNSSEIPFNIKDLHLDKFSNNFSDKAKEYDLMTSCPVKSFEFIHLVNKTPDWILDKDFQDIVAYPMFELMTDTFSLYLKDRIEDSVYKEIYKQKIETYGMILERYEELYLQNK